ncbi:MAG: PD-(D/E)XK nuclease family protein [Acidimicrobiia bacterium]
MPLDPPLEFPPVVPGDDVVLSASTFVAFERCPEQAAGRLRGVYGPESRSSFIGALAHRVFARHLSIGSIDDADFVAVCREEIGGGMNPKLAALGLKPSQLTGVIEEVGGLYDRFKTLRAEGFAGAEVTLEAEPADGVVLRGSIDAVFDTDGGVRLVDWKTGNLGEPDTQLYFYALLWALERGEIPVLIEAVSVKTGERTDAVPSRTLIDGTATKAARAVDALRESWRRGSELDRIAGPWCRWCPLLDECSEGRAAVEVLEA